MDKSEHGEQLGPFLAGQTGDQTATKKDLALEDATGIGSANYRFGCFGWMPDRLQKINRPVWLLVFMCWYTFTQVGMYPIWLALDTILRYSWVSI